MVETVIITPRDNSRSVSTSSPHGFDLENPAPAETISAIARHPKWKARPNLQIAILKNQKTPPVWFTLFLPRLKTPDLQGLLASKRLNLPQKMLAEQEMKKRGRG